MSPQSSNKQGEPKKLAWNAVKNLHGLLTSKTAKQTNHTPTVVLQGETTNDPQAACTMFAAHYETLGKEQPSENFCAETINTVTSALKSWREGAPQVIESMDSAFTIEELTFALKSMHMPMWKAGDHGNLTCELLRKGGPATHSVIRRKLQTPGTAEEHKRQETPTINPNDHQTIQLTDQAPGTIERAARESRHTTPISTAAVHAFSTATTRHHYPHPTGSSTDPLSQRSGLSRTTPQTPPASAGTHSAPPAWGALIRSGRRTAQGARPASGEGQKAG